MDMLGSYPDDEVNFNRTPKAEMESVIEDQS